MPKIRNKKSEISKFEKRQSGNLTKAYKKIIQDNENEQGFFALVEGKDTTNSQNILVPYNDNEALVFKKQLIHSSIGIGTNNIVHTPCDTEGGIFNVKKLDTNTINKNNEIKTTYQIQTKPFKDKDKLYDGYDVFDIELKFDNLKLSMNKTLNESENIVFNSETYECINGPTVFWNKNNRWDYVGDITENYFSNINKFLEAPIAFNCLSYYPEKINQTQKHDIGGKPVTTFGFPFDVKFQPNEDHEINMGDYISEDFYLKKVIIKFKNNLIKDQILQKPILSYLNFFILNVKNKSTENLYLEKDIEKANNYKYIFEDIAIQNTRTSYLKDPLGENRKFSYYSGQDIIVDEYNKNSKTDYIKYIDVITYGNELIYFDSVNEENNIYNENRLIENSEKRFIQTEEFKTLELNIKDTKAFGYCDYFSNFRIYPSKFNENKNFMNQNSNRCTQNNSELFSSASETITDAFSQNTKNFTRNTIESNYLLKTSDKLVLGINFSTPCNVSNEDNYSKEIMFLFENITFSFIGEYRNNENKVSFISNANLSSINSYRSFNGNSHIFYKNKTDEKTSSYNNQHNKIISSTTNFYNTQEYLNGRTPNNTDFYLSYKIFNRTLNQTIIEKQKSKLGNRGIISSRKVYLTLVYEEELLDNNCYNKLYYTTDSFGQSFNNLTYTTTHTREIKQNNVNKLFVNENFQYYSPTPDDYSGNIDTYSRIESAYVEE